MKVYEVRQAVDNGNWLIVTSLGAVSDCMGGIDDEDVGNKYTIEVKEMSKEDIEKLPEWGGF